MRPQHLQQTAAIETLNLRKVYGRKVAVEGVTMSVGRGEIFGFLGPNGAGKSTVIKMLMGLIYPTEGTARLLGRAIGDPEAKSRVGFLPEHFRFHEWLLAVEFLDFHGQLYGLSAQQRHKRCPDVLEAVGLASRGRDRLSTFSKGMLQRIGIAQALLNDPEIVFLDEPTSALDPLGRREVRDLIRDLKSKGKTVFLNSHLLSEVEMVCDRVAIINHGRIVRQGALGQLLHDGEEVELQIDCLTPNLRQQLTGLARIVREEGKTVTVAVSSREDVPLLAETVVHSGVKLYGLSVRRQSLEDLFISVVEGARE